MGGEYGTRILVGKREGKRRRRRWENNIKIDLQETECEDVDCIDLAHDGNLWKVLLNTVKNLRVP